MCASYIARGRGLNGETLEEVVEIMAEMHWLHTCIDYSTIVEDLKSDYREYHGWYKYVVSVRTIRGTGGPGTEESKEAGGGVLMVGWFVGLEKRHIRK